VNGPDHFRSCVHACTVMDMSDTEHMGIRDLRSNLGNVVHAAATRGRRTIITNNGRDMAVIMPIREVEDLEDRAAHADWRNAGSPTVGTLDELAAELGIGDPHGRAA
jgi:prevent-host-death family protein